MPSAVPLAVKVRMGHYLQGQRLRVRAESRIGGRTAQRAEGEVLFTPYGLSGTAILDVSESVSIALNRDGRQDVSVVVDLLPFMTAEEVAAEFSQAAGGRVGAPRPRVRAAAGEVLPVHAPGLPRAGLRARPGNGR